MQEVNVVNRGNRRDCSQRKSLIGETFELRFDKRSQPFKNVINEFPQEVGEQVRLRPECENQLDTFKA